MVILMANEIRERFRERKYSYKNKRKKIKENNEEIKAKNDDSPIKIVLFSPFLILGIIGKGIEKLGIKSQIYEKTDNNNISNTISYTKSNNVSLEEKNNIYVKKGNSKKIATNKELKTNDIKVHYKENKQIVNDNNKLENKILLKFGKELERLKNECEIVESEEYILNKYEDDNSIYLKAIDINNKINTLLKKLEKINKEYKLLKNNNLIEEPLLLDDSLLIDDIINYRKILQKEEINKIPKKIKLLEEYKYLYKNLDDLVEKTEKMKEISNKRVQELSARDKKYKDAKNKIVNLEEVENCCNLIIEKNNNYLEELSKKVDKISERKYVESKLKGMNGFLTSSLRYIWLLSLTPLRGILPGIGARTVATRKLLHNMLKNMHYEKQEKIIYSLGNYESEINNKIYDIDSLNYNIDLALEDVQKLKKEFKDYFLSYSFKEYDKAYKKIELIEKNKLKCMHLADVLDVEVICGDGTEIKVLADANTHKADCFIAVTGRDQDNLVASQLAKKRFQVKKVITRANNPRNLEALRKLGMENAVSSTEIITRMIEQEVESAEMRLLASLNKGKAAICEIVVPKDAKINGASLKDIELPHSSLIISILRDENLIIPQGDTQIYSGDEVVAVCDGHSQKRLMKILSEK